mmetsp:Transcript_2369/g.6697  ORF Transcript_2369/g.6697 Transcript_2369/m.6697 type:complete len:223 (-) Transcript_2369:102-770(-)
MHENVRSRSIGLDEAVLLLGREPLADTSSSRRRALRYFGRRRSGHWSWQRRRRLHDLGRRRRRRRRLGRLRRLLATYFRHLDGLRPALEVHHGVLHRVALADRLLEVGPVHKYISTITARNEAVLLLVHKPAADAALAAARRRRHRRRLRRGFGLRGFFLGLGGGGGGLLLLLARALVRHAWVFGGPWGSFPRRLVGAGLVFLAPGLLAAWAQAARLRARLN